MTPPLLVYLVCSFLGTMQYTLLYRTVLYINFLRNKNPNPIPLMPPPNKKLPPLDPRIGLPHFFFFSRSPWPCVMRWLRMVSPTKPPAWRVVVDVWTCLSRIKYRCDPLLRMKSSSKKSQTVEIRSPICFERSSFPLASYNYKRKNTHHICPCQCWPWIRDVWPLTAKRYLQI